MSAVENRPRSSPRRRRHSSSRKNSSSRRRRSRGQVRGPRRLAPRWQTSCPSCRARRSPIPGRCRRRLAPVPSAPTSFARSRCRSGPTRTPGGSSAKSTATPELDELHDSADSESTPQPEGSAALAGVQLPRGEQVDHRVGAIRLLVPAPRHASARGSAGHRQERVAIWPEITGASLAVELPDSVPINPGCELDEIS